MGLRHEWLFPGGDFAFNEEVLYRDLKAEGISTARIEANFLPKLGPEYRCIGDPEMNLSSVMMYDFPKKWIARGDFRQRSKTVTPRDLACIAALYSV